MNQFDRLLYHLYLDLLRVNLDDYNVRILAFCLMSNHVHWIIVPGTEDSLAKLFGESTAATRNI